MGIRIGPVKLTHPVILAPMSGVTDPPFRRLVKRLGAGLVVTEMIASKAMVDATRRTMRMLEGVDGDYLDGLDTPHRCRRPFRAESRDVPSQIGGRELDDCAALGRLHRVP